MVSSKNIKDDKNKKYIKINILEAEHKYEEIFRN